MNKTSQLGQYLVKETIDRGRGRALDYCVGGLPRDQFYVSNLSPEYEQSDRDDFDAKTRPSSIGLDCQPADEQGELQLEVDLYLPSVPTYDEYAEIHEQRLRSAKIEKADQVDDVDSWEEVADDAVESDRLYGLDEQFFRRITVTTTGALSTTAPDRGADALTQRLNDEIREAVAAFADEHPLTDQTLASVAGTVDPTAVTEEMLVDARQAVTTLPPSAIEWDLALEADVDDGELSVVLANHGDGDEETTDEGPGERYVFNPVLEYRGQLSPYEFDLIPEDYRYDQTTWAKGHNCSTTADRDAAPPVVRTTAVPTKPVHEFVFNSEYQTGFDSLANGDPVTVLEEILSGMRAYHSEWVGERKAQVTAELDLTPDEVAEYETAAAEFATEIEQFAHGVSILREEPNVRQAFQAMNEVNRRQHDFDGWRLFQIVYIVSNLSGVVSRELPAYEQSLDTETSVLWFPTGGGKTEAYLGLVLFNLFYDRLRGKDEGVTAWIRFPLRLLSRQQKGRFLESLLYAEEIRREDSTHGVDGAGEPFSLGFFAGSHDTPNAIGTDRDPYRDMFQSDQARLEDHCQVIQTCPLCESQITVDYLVEENRVVHRCTGSECLDELPLHVVDRDIYRHPPSVLLGSLDKIAILGMQPRFANLLGNVTTNCPVHGYGYSGRCSEHHLCDVSDEQLEDVDPDSLYDPIPTLHLIDEVHLLNEELGTFASHYETLYETLCDKIGGVTPKRLASTATIAEYERQIENLFQSDVTRFPAAGPVYGETFYGELTETIEREYLGFMPRNRSHLYAVLDTVIDYHQVIRDAYNASPAALAAKAGLSELTAEEQTEILDLYETSVVYFNSKNSKDRYRENITKYANNQMATAGYESPIIDRQLTADTESPELLDQLEEPGDTPFDERVDTVPSTSFIGHGIDVDRFNMMLFYGYPRQTFQYIQSSSRVGRQSGVRGFVLDVFNPLEERDKHRYRYFEKMHEYLDRTVEPVPIDRWAKFGIDRTFPGILQACLIQYFRPLLYRTQTVTLDGDTEAVNVQKASHLHEVMTNDASSGFSKAELKQLVDRAYAIDNGRYTNPYFESEVKRKTNQIWQYWRRTLPEKSFPDFPDGNSPMISLRDIGEQGDITVAYNNQSFVRHLTSGGDSA